MIFLAFRVKTVELDRRMRYNLCMIKIWAKVLKEEHIERQTTYTSDAEFHYADFFKILSEICDALDVPTPILLKTHLFQYAKFRRVVFKKGDFLEEPPFEKLILENIS